MSKNSVIDEIFEIIDSLIEVSYHNRQLMLQIPFCDKRLIVTDQYDNLNRQYFKQFDVDQLQDFLEETKYQLEQVQKEQMELEGIISDPLQYFQQQEENWDFLLDWRQASELDDIIGNLKFITNRINSEIEKAKQKQPANDDYYAKYQEALLEIEELKKQQFRRTEKKKTTTRMELIEELENKLEELEQEKDETSIKSMEALTRILQNKNILL
ncbi:hypothetical protein pb186bvf_017600 [Paramecium bursaria]